MLLDLSNRIGLPGINPYKISAGRELDLLIQQYFFDETSSSEPLHYSTDKKLADKVRSRLKTLYGHTVVAGETHSRQKPFFARFDNDPSTSTEVLAETYPLAVCRLALLLSENRSSL